VRIAISAASAAGTPRARSKRFGLPDPATITAGTAFASVDFKVYFLRPVAPNGQDLVAEGTVTHRGRTVAIGTPEVFNADGKKVAVASGSALVLPGRPATVTTELTPRHPLDTGNDEHER